MQNNSIMKFFESADDQPCYYCKKITEAGEKDYPIRDGI